jgi:hypothetical protein
MMVAPVEQQVCTLLEETPYGRYLECPYCAAVNHFWLEPEQSLDYEECCAECGRVFWTEEDLAE